MALQAIIKEKGSILINLEMANEISNLP